MPEVIQFTARQDREYRWYDAEPLSPRQRAARRKLELMRGIEKHCPQAYGAWLLSGGNPLVLATALDALARPWR
jgi:hypothetical protein